jgi:hypothetical protein
MGSFRRFWGADKGVKNANEITRPALHVRIEIELTRGPGRSVRATPSAEGADLDVDRPRYRESLWVAIRGMERRGGRTMNDHAPSIGWVRSNLAIARTVPAQFQEAIRDEYRFYERRNGFAGPPQFAGMPAQLVKSLRQGRRSANTSRRPTPTTRLRLPPGSRDLREVLYRMGRLQAGYRTSPRGFGGRL